MVHKGLGYAALVVGVAAVATGLAVIQPKAGVVVVALYVTSLRSVPACSLFQPAALLPLPSKLPPLAPSDSTVRRLALCHPRIALTVPTYNPWLTSTGFGPAWQLCHCASVSRRLDSGCAVPRLCQRPVAVPTLGWLQPQSLRELRRHGGHKWAMRKRPRAPALGRPSVRLWEMPALLRL